MRSGVLFKPEEWDRAGRGKERQFIATEDDVRRWLSCSLPAKYAPYFFVGVDVKKVDKKTFHRIPFVQDLNQFGTLVSNSRNLWIWSKTITPLLDPLEYDNDPVFSINGLILLQHDGLLTNGKMDASRVSMVDEIVHKNTGTAFTHREYLIVFRQLKIDILKDLKYSSIAEDGDGICCEDKKLLLMTEAAFKKAMLGEKNYVNKPGFPL